MSLIMNFALVNECFDCLYWKIFSKSDCQNQSCRNSVNENSKDYCCICGQGYYCDECAFIRRNIFIALLRERELIISDEGYSYVRSESKNYEIGFDRLSDYFKYLIDTKQSQSKEISIQQLEINSNHDIDALSEVPLIKKNPKYWMTDSKDVCLICHKPVYVNHRHHCRICGNGHFCSECAPKRVSFQDLRICTDCYYLDEY